MRAGVALGSNLGDRLKLLRQARAAICAIPGVKPPILSSPIYETEPVDCEPGAGKFFNAVMEFSYAGTSLDLFEGLKRVEVNFGRPSDHARNVSRRIDIDLLYFGEVTVNTPKLTLPHPRISARAFVLQPLADIRPNLILPGQERTVSELLASVAQSAKLARLNATWEQE